MLRPLDVLHCFRFNKIEDSTVPFIDGDSYRLSSLNLIRVWQGRVIKVNFTLGGYVQRRRQRLHRREHNGRTASALSTISTSHLLAAQSE